MANSILTPVEITREALRVLHDKLNFLGNCNRQYDNRFAQTGAKIGTSLNIRMPSKYAARTTSTFAAQDHIERSTPLTVSSQYGVDVSFTSVELTMSLDDFSKRIITPAMDQLASTLEGAAINYAYKKVANFYGTTSTSMTFKDLGNMMRSLNENLAPLSDRAACLSPLSTVEFMDATKALFHDQESVRKQWREGAMGRTMTFDVYQNNLIPGHTIGSLAGTPVTTGTANATTTTANSWVSQTAVSITGATSTTTLKAGDVITLGTLADGFVDCHPETKLSYGRLKKYVVQADVTFTTAANTYDVTVKPGIMVGSGNGYQNAIMTGSDTSGLTVTNWGAASAAVGQDIVFHEDAFVFATADLEDVSKYGAWGARATQDGISMRIARQYAIASDTVPCRIDVLWGFAEMYPELACRHIHVQS